MQKIYEYELQDTDRLTKLTRICILVVILPSDSKLVNSIQESRQLRIQIFGYIVPYKHTLVYVLIYTPSLPFTGFESLPESVQKKFSKSPRNLEII